MSEDYDWGVEEDFMGGVKVSSSSNHGWMAVMAPYNAEFIDDLKSNLPKEARKWNAEDRCWEIKDEYWKEVEALVIEHFENYDWD